VEKADVTTGWSRPAVDEFRSLGYVDELDYFIECCAENKPAKYGVRGADGLCALKIMEAIYRSAKEGVTIKNDLLGKSRL
jgi:predicted dehydrogenase